MQYLCSISRKKRVMKFIFYMLIKIKVFSKLILSILMGSTRHAQSTQARFQYLYNISRKKLGMKLIFYMQVDIKVFHKLILPFMTGVARHAQVPKITSLQYFRKNVLDYLDIWYEHRPPSHTQSIQNNKFTISQDGMLNKLSWFPATQVEFWIGTIIKWVRSMSVQVCLTYCSTYYTTGVILKPLSI